MATKCDHNGMGFSDIENGYELHFEKGQEIMEGGRFFFYAQCDDCHQKVKCKCCIHEIEEVKE